MARRGITELATGAAVLLVAVGFLAYAVAHSGRTSGSGYPLIAKFNHIDGLSVGSDVRMAGVKIGSVEDAKIDPATFQAIVTLTVRDDIKLPKDSSAEIVSESLLGGKFLQLSPGGDEVTLKPNQTITITQSSISLEQLLGKFIFSMTSVGSTSPQGGAKPQDAKDGQSAVSAGGLPPLGGNK